MSSEMNNIYEVRTLQSLFVSSFPAWFSVGVCVCVDYFTACSSVKKFHEFFCRALDEHTKRIQCSLIFIYFVVASISENTQRQHEHTTE